MFHNIYLYSKKTIDLDYSLINYLLMLIFFVLLGCKSYSSNEIEYEKYEEVWATSSQNINWKLYKARTVENLMDFKISKDPELGKYGGYLTGKKYTATGFFRTQKIKDRWWIIDPEGNPFIHKGVAVVRPGRSSENQNFIGTKFQSSDNWIHAESKLLREYGFNGAGAWSDIDLIKNSSDPLIYTIIVQPMRAFRNDHFLKNRNLYSENGESVYLNDLIMVFDPKFDYYIDSTLSFISNYENDANLLGYFTDNELPWVFDALDRHLLLLNEKDPGFIAAKNWIEIRKGFNFNIDKINNNDRIAFLEYYFETYLFKVTKALKRYDSNHLYLGCRFNKPERELNKPEMFKIAGKYMDIISINHYFKWEPDIQQLTNWESWSNKPILISEWYIKGNDSDLNNKSGAGWVVPTQLDRGYFYQNFTLELLNSKVCVGWQWFRYQDEGLSNKGLFNKSYDPYYTLLESAKKININAYQIIKFIDN